MCIRDSRGRLPGTGRVDKGIPVGGEIPKSNGKKTGQTTEKAEKAEKSEKSGKSGKTQSGRGALPNRSEVPTFESLTVGGASSNGGASRGSGRAADGAPRQWGVASLGATIGYERTVDVKVEQDGVTVVGQPRIDVTTKGGNLLPVKELRRKVIRAVQKTARTWGPPRQGSTGCRRFGSRSVREGLCTTSGSTACSAVGDSRHRSTTCCRRLRNRR